MQRLPVDEPVGLRVGADQARRDRAHAGLLQSGGDVFDGVLQVLARRGRGTFGVAGDAGGEDAAVLDIQARHREVRRGAVDVQVGARRIAQAGDHVDQARAPAVLVELGVEALVELQVAPGGGAGLHLLEQRAQRPGPALLEALGRAGGGEGLERGADLVVLAQVRDGRHEDHGAALRVQAHEALALQGRQRLAHRRRAHAEAPCDLDLAQFGARRELACDDLSAQSLGHETGDGAR